MQSRTACAMHAAVGSSIASVDAIFHDFVELFECSNKRSPPFPRNRVLGHAQRVTSVSRFCRSSTISAIAFASASGSRDGTMRPSMPSAQPIPPPGSSQPELRRPALHRWFPPSLLRATVAQTDRQPRTHLLSSRVGCGQGISGDDIVPGLQLTRSTLPATRNSQRNLRSRSFSAAAAK